MNTQTIPTVRRAVTVNAPAARAFEFFTGSMTAWWPAGYHIGEGDMAELVIEPRTGGRWFERNTAGAEFDWGRVLAWEPTSRVLLSWHLDGGWQYVADPDRASEVEVTFTPVDGGRTRVEVEHRGFERHGPSGAPLRGAVADEGGWTGLLNRFVSALETA